MNILLTGSSGVLGSFLYQDLLQQNNISIIRNTRDICDLAEYDDIIRLYGNTKPDIIVHCAAYTDVKKSDKEPIKVFYDNICASINLIKFAIDKSSRFIFISTDFVFDGKKGFYKINDLINPQTIYAKSKASVELALSCYMNSLVIRTSFFGQNFPFECACVDRFTSKDYIDIIGPIITNKILSKQTGIVHVGTDRKSFYELASRRQYVKPCVCITNNIIGQDHSFSYD
jgi:dTDP-4-dehydrorhamnose reductase